MAQSGFAQRIQQLASETAIYGISTVLGRLVTFLLVPFYTQVFDPEQYGIVVLVYNGFVFLNVLYQYGMESAYLKFASGAGAASEKQRVFSTATGSLLGTSLVLSGLLVVLRGPVGGVLGLDEAWSYLLYYAAGILLADTLTIVPFAELRLANRPLRFATIRLINIFLNVALNVLLIVGLDGGVESVLIANLAASVLTLGLLLPVYRPLFRPVWDSGLWRMLLRFGLPFVPGGLGYALAERVNVYFLTRLGAGRVLALYGDEIDRARLAEEAVRVQERLLEQAGAVDPGVLAAAGDGVYGDYVVGIFGAVWKLGVPMMLVAQMFRFAWQPFFLSHAGDADARPLFARIFTLFSAAALFVVLAVSFFAFELVSLPLPGGRTLIRDTYWFGLYLIPIALLGYFFQGWYYNFMAGAYIEKRTGYFVYCTLAGGALSLVINALFVPRYGMLAAAWATSLSYALMALLLHGFVRRFYPVPYDWRAVLGLGAWAAALYAAWQYVPGLQVWWAEAGLLAAYLAGVLGLRVVSLRTLRSLLRRR